MRASQFLWIAALVLFALIWSMVTYVAWFDFDDCTRATRQIGESDPALAVRLKAECEDARLIWLVVLASGALVLLTVLWIGWRRSKKL